MYIHTMYLFISFHIHVREASVELVTRRCVCFICITRLRIITYYTNVSKPTKALNLGLSTTLRLKRNEQLK